MVTDEQLTELSHKIDAFLYQQIMDYQLEPLDLSSVIIARMIRLNESVNCEEHFYKLLGAVPNWTDKTNKRTIQ